MTFRSCIADTTLQVENKRRGDGPAPLNLCERETRGTLAYVSETEYLQSAFVTIKLPVMMLVINCTNCLDANGHTTS